MGRHRKKYVDFRKNLTYFGALISESYQMVNNVFSDDFLGGIHTYALLSGSIPGSCAIMIFANYIMYEKCITW